jgi:hypothetical protein
MKVHPAWYSMVRLVSQLISRGRHVPGFRAQGAGFGMYETYAILECLCRAVRASGCRQQIQFTCAVVGAATPKTTAQTFLGPLTHVKQ